MRILAALALALMAPQAALAQVDVSSSNPALGSVVKAPRSVTLVFSAPVDPASAAVSIVMTAMPGVENHGEMIIRNFTPDWGADAQTLTLNLRQPLRAGTYEVRWKAAGGDGEPATGVVNFAVK